MMPNEPFWSGAPEPLLQELDSPSGGLTADEVRKRLARYGENRLKAERRAAPWMQLLAQFKSPIVLILLLAAVLSFFLHDVVDASIILFIVLVSGLLGFWQEHGAAGAVRQLLAMIRTHTHVLRQDRVEESPAELIVPGDRIALSAGDLVPADCRLLESADLFVDEAALTGETYPVEKEVAAVPADAPLARRSCALFMGTHVVSGTARALVVHTGLATELGKVAERVAAKSPETEFERGVRRFGYLLAEVTLVMVLLVFAFNVYFRRPVLDSFLFAMALAVGLTPQLLPAVVSVNLAYGARRMAKKKVIVRRLSSLENFGSMDVLCTDKTGTITEGRAQVEGALDPAGTASERVFLHAYLNAVHESGFTNPIDAAIREHAQPDVGGYRKLGEIPYDFLRKLLSVLVAKDGRSILVTKGAVPQVLAACSQMELVDGTHTALDAAQVQQTFTRLSSQGLRTLGVAYRDLGDATKVEKGQESGMVFLGFLALSDPPKAGAAETIRQLAQLQVRLKVITGDNVLVAAHLAGQVGLSPDRLLSGADLRGLSDEALPRRASEIDIFAEVEPNQKERIIRALQRAGHVVGFMGDGINDAAALHAADVGISVDGAVDVAKEAASLVLLEHDLAVLIDGVKEGRRTFSNTLKYVFMATSANFGNMFSMAGASLFLRFLPMLPKQILLTNLVTDLPEMTIAGDSVDEDLLQFPQRWDIGFIRRFMFAFGALSSLFDFVTFGVLMLLLHATPEQFRTGWFIESVVSAAAVVMVIRTRKLFYRSRPARKLLLATLAVVVLAPVLPLLPGAHLFGFTSLPWHFYPIMAGIVVAYIASAEVAKRFFYRRLGASAPAVVVAPPRSISRTSKRRETSP